MKVLITCDMHELLKQTFAERGWVVDDIPGLGNEGVASRISDYNGLVISSDIKFDQSIIEKSNHLKFLARAGSGMENVNINLAESVGIQCISSPEGNRNAVAEHALGMLLSLMHNLSRSHFELKQGSWKREENRGVELSGKTVGLIGYGHTGSTFAKKLSGMEVRILAYDKFLTGFGNEYVFESSLNTIYEEADILSLHIPLTEETRQMVNVEFISRFRKNIILINTARGKVVNTNDLVIALQENLLAGVALDVFENERLKTYSQIEQESFNYLASHPNAILTPHVAGWSHESRRKIAEVIIEKTAIFT